MGHITVQHMLCCICPSATPLCGTRLPPCTGYTKDDTLMAASVYLTPLQHH